MEKAVHRPTIDRREAKKSHADKILFIPSDVFIRYVIELVPPVTSIGLNIIGPPLVTEAIDPIKMHASQTVDEQSRRR